MRKQLSRLYDASLALAACFLVGIFVLMIGESVVRKFGGYITGANELVGWFCAAAGFLALPATFSRGDMVRVGFLLDSLQPRLRKLAMLACLLLALAFVSYIVYAVSAYLWSGWRAEEMTQGMIEIAVWIPQSSFLAGAVLLWIAVVDELVFALRAPADTLHAEKAMSADDVSMH